MQKILNSSIDYEKDLDSILPNLYLVMKLRENYFFSNYIGGERSEIYSTIKDKLKDNYSADMELENFILLYPPMYHHINKTQKVSHEKFLTTLNTYKNTNSEILNHSGIV